MRVCVCIYIYIYIYIYTVYVSQGHRFAFDIGGAISFKKHVNKFVRTIKYILINFRQIRQCLPTDIAKIFMHATIFPHLSYCLTCWGQAGETVIKPLKSLYKQTLKTLDKKSI